MHKDVELRLISTRCCYEFNVVSVVFLFSIIRIISLYIIILFIYLNIYYYKKKILSTLCDISYRIRDKVFHTI